jgi:2-keto-4-pentenoate hydratase
MQAQYITAAAETLLNAWLEDRRIDHLPESCRPRDRAEGYTIQREIHRLSGQARFGWKIAATSVAGQQHINVDAPLAGSLLANRVVGADAAVPFRNNLMQVAEVEFAFRMAKDLAPRGNEYTVDEVLAAVATLHPAIEIPDSRYNDFTKAGVAQLAADNACASYFVLGAAAPADWRDVDLVSFQTQGWSNGRLVAEGSGGNVLGDPREALTRITNELNRFGMTLAAGEVVTTGTTLKPFAIKAGDRVAGEFSRLGRVEIRIAG